MTYQTIGLGTNLSQLASNIDMQNEAIRSHERGTTEPTIKPNGLIWFRTDYPTLGNAMVQWNGSAWVLLLDPDFPALNAGGSVAAAADLPMASHKLTGLAAGTTAGDSVRFEQVVLASGANSMSGDLNLNGHTLTNLGADLDMHTKKITNLAAPGANNDAARKVDVDNAGPTHGAHTNLNTTAQTVTLGFEPKLLVIHISGAASYVFSGTIIVDDTVALDTDATTTMMYWDVGGASTGHDLIVAVQRKATGFSVRVSLASLGSGTDVGQSNYVAYRA